MNSQPWLHAQDNGVIIQVLAQPKASRSEVVGPHGEPPRLKIRIAAPPVDGEANEELLRFLKKKLGVPSTQLILIRGQTSKMKDILCVGLASEEIQTKLGDSRIESPDCSRQSGFSF